jgi:hypothetical protein
MAHPNIPPQAPPDDDGCPPAAWPLGQRCPLCEREGTPYNQLISDALELVDVLQDLARGLKRAVERLVA